MRQHKTRKLARGLQRDKGRQVVDSDNVNSLVAVQNTNSWISECCSPISFCDGKERVSPTEYEGGRVGRNVRVVKRNGIVRIRGITRNINNRGQIARRGLLNQLPIDEGRNGG